MHDVLAVEVGKPLTNILKITLDVLLADGLHLDLFKERASICVLEDHISNFPLCIDMDINKLDNLGVRESIMHQDFILGDLIDLNTFIFTTLTATMLLL